MTPDVIAKIKLYETDVGGRCEPTPSDQFGCLVEINGEYFDCRLMLESIGSLRPGQIAIVPIKFLRPDLVCPLLRISQDFRLWDGKTVGNGEVQEIVAQAE
jgi:hypothetical protein